MADAEMPGRTILITGGAKRVGAHFTRRFWEAGWRVVVHYNSSATAADALVADMNAKRPGSAWAFGQNFDNLDAAEGLLNQVDRAGIKLDALINNASVFEFDRPEDIQHAQLASHAMVNLYIPSLLAESFFKRTPETAAVAPLEETGDEDVPGAPVVINILDAKLFGLNPDYFSYTISKFGLLGATRMMAVAFAPRARVCGIAPGITMVSGEQNQASFEAAHKKNPLGRSSTPEDLFRAAQMITDTPSMTGRVIILDGGTSLINQARDVAYL
ncbi:MAG: SDR family oxidoreductase [Pseudomonadota bacterium]